MRFAAQKLRHWLRLVRTLTPTQMRRPALRSMPRIMPTLLRTLLRTLLPSLVPRHSRVCRQPISRDQPPEWSQSRGVVRVNQRRDGVSPVAASIYCSPCHPSALQIDSPPCSGILPL